MITRAERKNMIRYIQKMRRNQTVNLVIMTDKEIEHIYTKLYTESVLSSDC